MCSNSAALAILFVVRLFTISACFWTTLKRFFLVSPVIPVASDVDLSSQSPARFGLLAEGGGGGATTKALEEESSLLGLESVAEV